MSVDRAHPRERPTPVARWTEALQRPIDAILERLLGPAGTDEARLTATKLLAFRRFLLVAMAVEMWERVRLVGLGQYEGPATPVALVLTVCAMLAWTRWAREASLLAALALLFHHVAFFPAPANHQYVELLLCGFLAFFDPAEPEERRAAMGAIGWLFLLAFFLAGVQKLLWGTYFRGEFLATAVAARSSFAALFALVVPPDELERILALGLAPSSGPYRIDSTLFVLMSNLTWITELAVPPLFLFPRLRSLAIVSFLVFFVAIEAGAREFIFGSIMIQSCLLMARRDWNTPLLWLSLPVLATFLLTALDVVPRPFEWH